MAVDARLIQPVRRPSGAELAAGAAAAIGLALLVRRFSPAGVAYLVVVLAFLASAAFVLWRASPVATFTVALVLAPISGNWENLGVPGILSPNRIVLAVGVAAVLMRAAPSRTRPQLKPHAAHWLMLVAGTYAVLSAVLSSTLFSRASVAGLTERYGLLPFLAFFAMPAVFRTERDRRVLLWALVALGAYLGLTALFETVGLDALVFPRYINNPNVGILPDRARGPFADPVANAFAMFACAGAAVMAVGTWRATGARLFAAATALLCAAGIVFTLTRGAWLGATAAALLMLVVVPEMRRRALPILAGGAVAIAIAVVAIPGLSAKITERGSTKGTIYDRYALNQAALNMIEARPLLGFGWGRYFEYNRDYLQQGEDYPLPPRIARFPVHNLYLGFGAELGLVGTGLWLAALVTAIGGALLRPASRELLAWRYLLLGAVVFYLSISNFAPTTTFPTLLLLFLTGVVNSGSPAWAFVTPPSAGEPAGTGRSLEAPAR